MVDARDSGTPLKGTFLAWRWIGLPAACVFATPVPGTDRPPAERRTDVAVIYFPGYHRDTHYDAWFGEGWNEWTEGSVLLPDVQYKTQFLEELQKALSRR